MDEPHIEHKPDHHRFEVLIKNQVAGFTTYKDAAENRAFVHTEVYPQWEGMGLGKVLVSAALDQTRTEGLGVLPFCPFVHRFITKNLDYLDLVPLWARDRLGLPDGEN